MPELAFSTGISYPTLVTLVGGGIFGYGELVIISETYTIILVCVTVSLNLYTYGCIFCGLITFERWLL